MHTNRLSQEKSPYLLQHAHNPVDWRPWGKEAFEEAKKTNKPEFVSANGTVVSKEVLDAGFQVFRRTFDTQRGGFGGAPKFPRPVTFNFLLRYYARTHNKEALDMAAQTLRAMAKGGMNDQLGGG